MKFLSAAVERIIPEILERFQVVDDVCHGSPYAFATTNRRQVRDFFASTDGQTERSFSYPRLLNLHIVRHVLDQFVNCRLVVLAGSETRDVRRLTTGFCFSSDGSVTACFKVTTASAMSCPPAVRLPANFDPGARAGPALLVAA